MLCGLDGSARSADDAVLTLLADQGLLVDERAVLPLLGPHGRPDDQPGSRLVAAALSRHRGASAPEAAAGRGRSRLHAVRFGPDCAADGVDVAGQLLDLATRVGLRDTAAAARAGRHRTPGSSDGEGCVPIGVLAGIGEPDRELADPWTQTGTPYVVVRITEGRAVVGPFVVPGETACLRCVDAHHTDADPAWPLLVHQYSRATTQGRGDGLAEPVDPTLVALAVAWAVRDLASHADGVRPSTWSATVSLDAQLGAVESRSWLRHPECGCSWG